MGLLLVVTFTIWSLWGTYCFMMWAPRIDESDPIPDTPQPSISCK